MKRAVLACLLLFGCTSGDGKTIDGAPITAGSFGAACTVVTNNSSECTSGVCTNTFDMVGHPLCSVQCTMLGMTDPVCPNGSAGQKCNTKGYCKP
jgi:hypothetical protein